MKKILSLFDFTGTWPKPYKDAGYEVTLVDIKHGFDIHDIDYEWIEQNGPFHGIMAAVPCTDFAGSGAQYWPAKDADGRTQKSIDLLIQTMTIIGAADPKWWVIENPVGRINRLIGKPKMYFHPYEFGGWMDIRERTHDHQDREGHYLTPCQDAYKKKTGLWGEFKKPYKKPVCPISSCDQGSWVQKLGGKSERTKYLRSITPTGFARAFYEANP